MNRPRFSSLWRALKDPRRSAIDERLTCDIKIDEGFWSHNEYKHLNDRSQPWSDLFGDQLWDEARTLAKANGAMDGKFTVLQQVANALEHQVRCCLNRPLALLFDLYRERTIDHPHRRLCERWLLVLPVGAFFRVRTAKAGSFAESCYFPLWASQIPRASRWLSAVESLVIAFGKHRDGQIFTRRKDEAIGPWRGRQGIRGGQHAQNIRFVSHLMWGFGDGALPLAWSEHPIPAWAEAEAAAPSTVGAARKRLNPISQTDEQMP